MGEAGASLMERADAVPGSVQSAINALTDRFRSAGLPTPELDARLLVLDVCGLSREAYFIAPARAVSLSQAERIEAVARRRLGREPVSRILGRREFWGREFLIGPAVLDPRPDTETLVETALAALAGEAAERSAPRILDLGTGSGCILLSLLAERPDAWGLGVDIDPAALAVASRNAERLGLADRCAFVCGNWCDTLLSDFDLIISNPPYIERSAIASLEADVRSFDPEKALDGGTDGLDAYRRIASGCQSVASPGSWIMMEAGRGQADDIIKIFRQAGLAPEEGGIQAYSDMSGVQRVVAIMRQARW